MRINKRIGDILVESKLVTGYQVAEAAMRAKNMRKKIGEELVALRFLTEADLAYVLGQQLGIKWISLKNLNLPQEVIDLVSKEIAKTYLVIPISMDKRFITLATSDPLNIKVLDMLTTKLGKMVVPVIATPSDIKWAINKYYEETDTPEVSISHGENIKGPKLSFEHKVEVEQAKDKDMLETLVTVLIEKGILTKDELYKRIEKKS